MRPSYPLKDIKALIRANHCHFNDDALQDAHNDFGWGPQMMQKSLLRLNDRLHRNDRNKNHFHKTAPHLNFPNTKMDYYKIVNGLEDNSIYTHFYINPTTGMLIVSSFKEL